MRKALFLSLLTTGHLLAQVPVPVITAQDRFLIFHDGRFEEIEPRPPAFAMAMEGQVVYKDHQGRLKLFLAESGAVHLLDGNSALRVRGTRHRIAWLAQDTLKTLRDGRVIALADHVQAFTVSDSLIVLSDSTQQELNVVWKGKVITLATVERGAERPQWVHGLNTASFFDRQAHRLHLFHQGRVLTLCDSTDVGLVACSGDIAGYWNGAADTFNAWYKGLDTKVSELRPASAQAGAGLLAFVDGNGRLKCYERGTLHTVLAEPPSEYWVQDSLLLFMHQGGLWLFHNGVRTVVEHYVPERWQVEGGLLAYLDINRELHGIINGERFRFGKDANIPAFELFGSAVVYRTPLGNTVVATRRRTYVF